MHIQIAEGSVSVNSFILMIHTVVLSPSTHERIVAVLYQTTYMLGLVFIRTSGTFPSSCSAVLTAIHCPLHLQRSQHYQPPPPLRWQRSSFCLPGLQPLPPPALSLFLSTVPEIFIQRQTYTLTLPCAVTCATSVRYFAMCTHQWRRPDVCWDLWSCKQVYGCSLWTNSTAVKQWVGSLSSLLYLKGTNSLLFIH